MSDLDPVMLAKFQKFQAMLAESPEIVAALNSPEILAMAALAAENKNSAGHAPAKTPAPCNLPEPSPEPQYPMVGPGHSDDVSVCSEMTTPTVMTRQTVEEDEFYPEIDATGVSSSGIGGGPRRIGIKIGVTALESGGALPPPPPKASKAKNRVGQRRGRAKGLEKPKPAAMSKISEHDGSVTTESTEPELRKKRPSLTAKKGNWKPKARASLSMTASKEIIRTETHPFNFGGAGNINRNKSMPTNIKGLSSSSLHSKRSSDSAIRRLSGSSLHSKRSSDSAIKQLGSSSVHSQKSSDSGSRASFEGGVETPPATASSVMPKPTSKATQKPPPRTSENRGRQQTQNSVSGGVVRKSRGSSVPRLRLVPVTKNNNPMAAAATGSLTRSGSDHNKTKTARRQKTTVVSEDEGEDNALHERPTTPKQDSSVKKVWKYSNPSAVVAASIKSNNERDNSNDGEPVENDRSSSTSTKTKSSASSDDTTEDSQGRSPVTTRRWTPPPKDDTTLPPAFRKSLNSTIHSQKSRDGTYDSSRLSKNSSARYSSHSKGTAATKGSSVFSTKSQKVNPATVAAATPSSGGTTTASEEQKKSNPSSSDSSQVAARCSMYTTGSTKSSPSSPKSKTIAPSSTKPSGNGTNSEEEQKKIIVSTPDDDDEVYVPRTVRKPAAPAKPLAAEKRPSRTGSSSGPNPSDFTNFSASMVSNFLERQGDTSRPDDYLPGTDTFSATRKKKEKKKFSNTGETRVDAWLGSGKTQKRTWKVKETSS